MRQCTGRKRLVGLQKQMAYMHDNFILLFMSGEKTQGHLWDRTKLASGRECQCSFTAGVTDQFLNLQHKYTESSSIQIGGCVSAVVKSTFQALEEQNRVKAHGALTVSLCNIKHTRPPCFLDIGASREQQIEPFVRQYSAYAFREKMQHQYERFICFRCFQDRASSIHHLSFTKRFNPFKQPPNPDSRSSFPSTSSRYQSGQKRKLRKQGAPNEFGGPWEQADQCRCTDQRSVMQRCQENILYLIEISATEDFKYTRTKYYPISKRHQSSQHMWSKPLRGTFHQRSSLDSPYHQSFLRMINNFRDPLILFKLNFMDLKSIVSQYNNHSLIC